VGRETVRYYIREGLLPEPERSSRNSAFYNEDHVRRLKAIKRLQEERFLPLSVIRTMLDAEDAERWLAPGAFPMLDALLAARVDGTAVLAFEPLTEVVARLALEPGFAEGHLATGMIGVDEQNRLSARDVQILTTLKRLSDVGFSSRNDFFPQHLGFFVELMDWVVTQEMKLFFGHLAGRIGEAEAADMALEGITLINEVLAQLHVRGALRHLAERHHSANDNS